MLVSVLVIELKVQGGHGTCWREEVMCEGAEGNPARVGRGWEDGDGDGEGEGGGL
jgi:hypothetical protein